jgi:hypothetical protein
MGVNFVPAGGLMAEVLGWRITVKDGVAMLDGEHANAFAPDSGNTWEPWDQEYTVEELRDLAALFTVAAHLLEAEQRQRGSQA